MPTSTRSVGLMLLVALWLPYGVRGPSEARAQLPIRGRDWPFHSDPSVQAGLVGFQSRFDGKIQTSAMLPLQPGAKEHTIRSVPLRDAPSLTDLLHEAWRAEAAASCPDVVRLVEQRIRAEVQGSRLVDVQCFINPIAASGARVSPDGLQYRLFNRRNRIDFTIGGIDFAPRFILHFGLMAEIDLRLSRGAPNEQGQVLRVTRAEIKTRDVHVAAGNFTGRFAGGARHRITESAKLMTMKLTGRMQGRVGQVTQSFLSKLPGLSTLGALYFRSQMTDSSLRSGIFPVLVLVGRPHLAPFDVKVTAGTFPADIEASLPRIRPVGLKYVELRESGQVKIRAGSNTNRFTYRDMNYTAGQQLTYEVCTINEFDEPACAARVSVRSMELIIGDNPIDPTDPRLRPHSDQPRPLPPAGRPGVPVPRAP